MHGLIFTELKKFATDRFGADAWNQLVADAQPSTRIFLMTGEYPDSDLVALVQSASKVSGTPVPTLLERFGEFIAPDLMKTYRSMINPDWKTLDLVENTEGTMHKAVRARNPGAQPPRLEITRQAPNEVLVTYRSPRKMCYVGKGIIKGIAKEYGERVTLTESTCMNRGGDACRITVRG